MEEIGGGQLTVLLREEGRMAVLSIIDQGGGIPEAIRDKIFDLYFTTKKAAGSDWPWRIESCSCIMEELTYNQRQQLAPLLFYVYLC